MDEARHLSAMWMGRQPPRTFSAFEIFDVRMTIDDPSRKTGQSGVDTVIDNSYFCRSMATLIAISVKVEKFLQLCDSERSPEDVSGRSQ